MSASLTFTGAFSAGLDGLQPLTGPFSSGPSAIFAHQAARLGQPVGIISCVGNGEFWRIKLCLLPQDGVDMSAIHIDEDRLTGSAFFIHRADGSRRFDLNIKYRACRYPLRTPGVRMPKMADRLQVMGATLASADFVDLNLVATKAIAAGDGSVLFGPDLRNDVPSVHGMAWQKA